MKFDIPKTDFLFFNRGHRIAFKPQKKYLPADWVEKHFILSSAYAVTGRIKLFPWQREIVNACEEVDELYLIAPVQTGKSLIAECIIGYKIDTTRSNMMLTYSKKETLKDIFEERLRPLILECPALKKYWSGNQDDLTKTKLALMHSTLRICGAGVSARDDIASHNAAVVYGAEVSKWPHLNIDQIKMLRGRQKASQMFGEKTFMILESSPRTEGDKFYRETHKQGVDIRHAYHPCPHCGNYQVLTDSQIKEKPDRNGDFDHDPERIRSEKAARYECEFCKGEITERHRINMANRLVWATKAEEVLKDGTILNRKPARRRAYNWSRLINYNYTFYECLASYFEALNNPDPEALVTYQNEDMARFVKTVAKKYNDKFIVSKKQKYLQYGDQARVPNEVLVLLTAIDTQDNGFYYAVRGYGANLESWLIRHDFIPCPMDADEYQDPKKVLEQIEENIFKTPYVRKDGKKLPVVWGLIDRGGHRSNDVDYICNHNMVLSPYIGSTFPTAPLIELKKSGYYFCNKRNLATIVEKQMNTALWHLPNDVTSDYIKQVLNQYQETTVDIRGNKKTVWRDIDPDHYRDCENMLAAAAIHLQLNEVMNDQDSIDRLNKKQYEFTENKKTENVEKPTEFFNRGSYLSRGGWGR